MERLGSRAGFAARLAVASLALGVAVGALAIAEGPGRSTTYAGSSSAGAVLTVAAGLGLIAAGVATTLARGSGAIGDLALLAGLTWFAPVLVAWREGSPLVISLATALVGFTFAFLFHLVLAYPAGRLRSSLLRTLVFLVYVETLLAAVALALIRDPYSDPGCWANCTVNSFLVHSLPSSAHTLEVADRWFVAAAAVALAAISAGRLARGTWPARRRLLPIALPTIVLAGALAAHATVLQRTTVEDPFDSSLFAIFAVGSAALALLAGGLIWAVARARIERRAVARAVADLDEAPAPGSLASALAEAIGDPALEVSYWLPEKRHYVDASGRSVPEPVATPRRALTRLTRNEATIATISHAGGTAELASQLGPAVRLALENERLQAQVLAQIEELRASRTRIVETADLERRRLERDLHDGAQQRLLALSYDVRLARAGAEADADTATAATLAEAIEQTQVALQELRDLAHGIYPAVLTEAGLSPALESLAEVAPLPVEIRCANHQRYPAPVETAAYFAVAEAIDDACRRNASNAAITVAHSDGRLVVTVGDDGSGRTSTMTTIAERVGALGGSVEIGTTTFRAEIPCA